LSTGARARIGPEAEPFIDEVDGLLLYARPECRKALEEFDPPLPRE
jgi:hypothetical protein